MAEQNKKRAADQTTGCPIPKRVAMGQPSTEVIEILEDEPLSTPQNYQTSATIDKKFRVFPDQLCKNLEKQYLGIIKFCMLPLFSGGERKSKYTYSIVTERRVRQSFHAEGPTVTVCKLNYTMRGLANTAILEQFMRTHMAALKDPKFIFLEKREGLANPGFTHLHAVHHDEIGWGFDTFGCLSLYLLYVENDKLKEYVIYVERAELKLEAKD